MFESEDDNCKYINEPAECRRTADEFLQEFKDHVYPAYASFGFTLFEAISIWKLNAIYNSLNPETLEDDEEDWKSKRG